MNIRTITDVSLLALIVLYVDGGFASCENTDPYNVAAQYAYGENVGWINAEPLGNGGSGTQVDDFQLTGWMWSGEIGWISLSCKNTSSCSRADYGVRNDGRGTLSGFAWAENVGWINLAPSTAGVSIDPATGEFTGLAWGENIGWINFGPFTGSITTEWRCDPMPPTPTGVPMLTMNKTDSETVLLWTDVPGATGFDVITGDLQLLRSRSNPFRDSTLGCRAENEVNTSISVPIPEGDTWFLVRPANCGGSGTYDLDGIPRDAEIGLSGSDCLR